jgi:hypothetical protein
MQALKARDGKIDFDTISTTVKTRISDFLRNSEALTQISVIDCSFSSSITAIWGGRLKGGLNCKTSRATLKMIQLTAAT